jgi:hypothetical protein
MQNLAKKARKALEQAELNAAKAENYVEALEFEIAVVERKGYIEESFWRFPHIGEKIFKELDDNSLYKCLEVNKWWQKFIKEKKIRQINMIQKHTYIKSSILKKELSNKDFETVQNLANYSMKLYKKVIVDGMNIRGRPRVFESSDSVKQQKAIFSYIFEKKFRHSIQQLLRDLIFKLMVYRGDTCGLTLAAKKC